MLRPGPARRPAPRPRRPLTMKPANGATRTTKGRSDGESETLGNSAQEHTLTAAGCIFCRIAAGTEPSWQVWENEYAYAFLDKSPATIGHTLVVPRVHAADIWDISRQDVARLMETVHDVARLLNDKLRPDGLTLFQANRAAGWQEVFHMHIHLVPRYAGDQLTRAWTARPAAEQELDEVLNRIR
jgi:histidine triad (HIT) family protein